MKCRVISKRSDVPGLVFRPFLSVPDKPVIAVQLQEMGNVEHPFASEGAFEGQVGSWKIT